MDKKMSFEDFVAKADSVNSAELMEMITGGHEGDCHPGNPNCPASDLTPAGE
jgi:hypothetical protein